MTGATASNSPLDSGASRFPRADQLIGKFPNLEIMHLIGHGGMASVYLARQTNLDRVVALKVLSPHLSNDPAFTERFVREARTLAKLTHPNIVTLFDFGQSEGMHYLVMEYVDGINLRDAIEAGTIEPQRALEIVPSICSSLQYAHDQGVIHRDIKPENILLDKSGTVKIADFGLAKLLQPKEEEFTLTATRQVLGTLKYMAPEQIERPETVDHRADLYSLGVVFYELLTGELPIGRFALPSEKAKVTNHLDEVVMKTLEKEPARRYQQASQFRTAIESLDGLELAEKSYSSPTASLALDKQSARAVLRFSAFDASYFLTYGILRAMSEGIEVQCEKPAWNFRMSNNVSEFLKYDDISSIKFSSGLLEDSIEIKTNSLDASRNLPGAGNARVKLHTRKRDVDEARQFIAQVKQHLPPSPEPTIDPVPPTKFGAPQSEDWMVTPAEILTAKERLKVPRVGLFIAGMIYSVAALVLAATMGPSFLRDLVHYEIVDTFSGPQSGAQFIWELVALCFTLAVVLALLCFACHYHLGKLRNFHFLVAALIVICAILPFSVIALPFGIWALVVLCLKDTRRVFRYYTLDHAVEKKNESVEPGDAKLNQKKMYLTAGLLVVLALVAFMGLTVDQAKRATPVRPTPPASVEPGISQSAHSSVGGQKKEIVVLEQDRPDETKAEASDE